MDKPIERTDWDLAQIGKLSPDCLQGQTVLASKVASNYKPDTLPHYMYKEQIVQLTLPPQLSVPVLPMPTNVY